MDIHNINLNIHYTVPDELWNKIIVMYAEMPYWRGFVDGCPRWEFDNGSYIEASVEPSGLQFYAQMSTDEWEKWIHIFKKKAEEIMGYEIGEPEDGFEFRYYE